ncbi:response regulator [Kiloniella sp. b19]|uniref:response regulator n=1 Tax=Kiloniella sp. GXU_MW_B19 TaxID=3141326 RepID=UPI0031E0BF06
MSFDDTTMTLLIAFLMTALLVALLVAGLLYYRSSIFSRSLSAIPSPRQIVSPKGKVLHVNSAFAKFFPGEQRPIPTILLEKSKGHEDVQRSIKSLALNVRNGVSGQIEIELPVSQGSASLSGLTAERRSGDTQWLRISAYPVEQRAGYALWLLDDITVRRQMQQILDDQQERFVDLLENAPIGFFSVDEEGRFLFANQTLTEWLGYSSSELESGAINLHGLLASPLPDDIPAYHPFSDMGKDTDEVLLTVRGKDGETEQILVSISQHIARDNSGDKGFRTRSVVRNLTREREMLVALEQSEKRFRTFFDEAPVAIVLVDANLRVKECNAAFLHLLGGETKAELDAGQLENRDLVTLFADEHAEAVAEIFENKESHSGLVDVILNHRVCSLQVTALEIGTGLEGGYLLNFIDATEQRNLEAQFAQSQKMQAVGQLAGGIAHDFNNLLTAMIGFSDLLLMRHRPGDQSFSDIMQIKQNANRAANLVRQLLAFSRQQALQPKRLNVTDILAELAHLLRRLMGESLELRIAHGRDLGDIRADQGQLEQVIINLAVNARDAMDHGGRLEIVTSNVVVDQPYSYRGDEIPAGDYVLIKVQDNGHGIPGEIIDRIFDPFFSTKELGAGTGLGLSTVYGIVKQSNGFIFVDSEAEKGTTFTLLFPHYQQSEEELEQEALIEDKAQDLTGIGSILLVEDEDAVRAFSARALRNKGYDVLEANSGEHALEVLDEHGDRVDLIISDVVMPNMDGPTLIKKLHEHNPSLKVIFISGYTEDAFRQSLSDNEGIDFLPKPFSLKQLASKVKDVLG